MKISDSPADRPPLSTLSEREREVLRLVARGLQTGEIAQIVGRAPGTIDTQIKSARTKLGGITRRQAARLLVENEATQSTDNHPLGIADPQFSGLEEARQPELVREERAIFLPEFGAVDGVEPDGGGHDHLRAIALIVVITIGLIVILAATPGLIASFKLFAAWILNLYR